MKIGVGRGEDEVMKMGGGEGGGEVMKMGVGGDENSGRGEGR